MREEGVRAECSLLFVSKGVPQSSQDMGCMNPEDRAGGCSQQWGTSGCCDSHALRVPEQTNRFKIM